MRVSSQAECITRCRSDQPLACAACTASSGARSSSAIATRASAWILMKSARHACVSSTSRRLRSCAAKKQSMSRSPSATAESDLSSRSRAGGLSVCTCARIAGRQSSCPRLLLRLEQQTREHRVLRSRSDVRNRERGCIDACTSSTTSTALAAPAALAAAPAAPPAPAAASKVRCAGDGREEWRWLRCFRRARHLVALRCVEVRSASRRGGKGRRVKSNACTCSSLGRSGARRFRRASSCPSASSLTLFLLILLLIFAGLRNASTKLPPLPALASAAASAGPGAKMPTRRRGSPTRSARTSACVVAKYSPPARRQPTWRSGDASRSAADGRSTMRIVPSRARDEPAHRVSTRDRDRIAVSVESPHEHARHRVDNAHLQVVAGGGEEHGVALVAKGHQRLKRGSPPPSRARHTRSSPSCPAENNSCASTSSPAAHRPAVRRRRRWRRGGG